MLSHLVVVSSENFWLDHSLSMLRTLFHALFVQIMSGFLKLCDFWGGKLFRKTVYFSRKLWLEVRVDFVRPEVEDGSGEVNDCCANNSRV